MQKSNFQQVYQIWITKPSSKVNFTISATIFFHFSSWYETKQNILDLFEVLATLSTCHKTNPLDFKGVGVGQNFEHWV